MRLDNLETLSPKELIEIKNNTHKYYQEYTETQLQHIKILINLLLKDDFPSLFKLDTISIEVINGVVCFINSYKQVCFNEDDKLVCMPLFYKVDGETFKDRFTETRESHMLESRWRVDNSYNADDYKYADNYMTTDGSTISIKDEDIISVCTMIGGMTRGKDLLKHAVQNGGKKLDAYENLFTFYVKSGFMPISYCKWEDEYAPDDWKLANNFTDDSWKNLPDTNFDVKREDIIFFIYTGNTEDFKYSYKEWKNLVECSSDYDSAKLYRDKILNKLGGNGDL